MKRQYLGDSYDALKRLWHDVLEGWAPLHAERRFIPIDLRDEFTTMTRIPMYSERPGEPVSILNDPDTGIRLPDGKRQSEGTSHVTLATIRDQVRRPGVKCVVTFDQSNHRDKGKPPRSQRDAKRRWLKDQGVESFYYVSHAPFLFAFPNGQTQVEVAKLLKKAGIPKDRIEA